MEDSLLKSHKILKNIYAFWFQWCKKSKSSRSTINHDENKKKKKSHSILIFPKGKENKYDSQEKMTKTPNLITKDN